MSVQNQTLKVSSFAPKVFPSLPVIEGMSAKTMNCGIKKKATDLLVISFEKSVTVAGVFTQSTTAAAPVKAGRAALEHGHARALIVNSGNANAFTGKEGERIVEDVISATAKELKCHKSDVFMCSTGVIGQTFDSSLITSQLPKMLAAKDPIDWQEVAASIMTTDTFPKAAYATCQVAGKEVKICGVSKGSGMIEPNMATMLGFVFCDVNIGSEALQDLVSELNEESFNSITVDGDTSTNDTFLCFATGNAGNKKIDFAEDKNLVEFKEALRKVMIELAQLIIKDGEGITKFVTVKIEGADDHYEAKLLAKTIANSPLIKTAIYGHDANWGRLVMALGKSGVNWNENKINIEFCGHKIITHGKLDKSYDDKAVTRTLAHGHNIDIYMNLNTGGEGKSTVWTCDFSHAYVDINASYRS